MLNRQIKGRNGQISLSETMVIITRKGFISLISQGLKGEKRIPYESIKAIQFKDPSMLTAGYIQFSVLGGMEGRGGVFNAALDENTVMFDKNVLRDFQAIRNIVEERITETRHVHHAPSQSSSVADELAKLADLLDRGALTAEEFGAQKAALLQR